MTRELLFSLTKDDFEVQHFRSGGPGGQNQNKVNSGTRIIHHPSGARAESRDSRDQIANKKTALRKLAKRREFLFWVHEHVRELDGKQSAEQWVEVEMQKLEHFKIEYKQDGKWVEV